MNRYLFASADFLAKPPGFWWVMAAMLLGSAWAWFGVVEIVTYALSVLAIIYGGMVLLQGSRDTTAIHVKLDTLIHAAEEAQNDLVGLEHETVEVIEARRAEVERTAKV